MNSTFLGSPQQPPVAGLTRSQLAAPTPHGPLASQPGGPAFVSEMASVVAPPPFFFS